MKTTASTIPFKEIKADVLIVPVFEGDSPQAGILAELNAATGGQVALAFERGEISPKRDRWTLLDSRGGISAARLLVYGAGSSAGIGPVSVQRLAGAAARIADQKAASSAAIFLSSVLSTVEFAQAAAEGATLGVLTPDFYVTKDDDAPHRLEEFAVASNSLSEGSLSEAVERGALMAEATNFARELGFAPSNDMTPSELARRAEEMASREGLQYEALGEDRMKQMGMGALLAVSRGSQEPARLIVLRYESGDRGVGAAVPAGKSDRELIALIGKGITFDSGGISIKPALNMEEMKYDMGGGAAVIGAMQILARLRPNARVLGLVPASENLPSGRAFKPGDVIRSLSGKTIEVANTDAEGRLVLCDAITYAIEQGATMLVDAATLTGAVVVALGEVRAAVMGNDDELIKSLVAAGERSGERVWPLPMDKEYVDLIKSDIADIRNAGNRTGGSITAGWFLRHFVGETPWAHLDIAGTAWTEREKPYIAKGATGFGTRLLANFVIERARSKN
ncbi:MAG TPA: leucyl aminopeptidase [Blastocatellia bacterium]|nr:leucyl aminopeptidase [Blastocatellia bacterium]